MNFWRHRQNVLAATGSYASMREGGVCVGAQCLGEGGRVAKLFSYFVRELETEVEGGKWVSGR